MLHSSTVENYLKAIYVGMASLPPAQRLVPMGQLASALGVAPGTATTMVKTLAESGLVTYEPYAGVTLTSAGKKLAALVLRRHRLIELFLVRVMGYSWDEVHDEAEQLDEPVPPQHQRRELLAGRRQRDTGVGLVLHEARLGERLHHRGGGAGRHAERGGELPHWQQPLSRLEGVHAEVDRLQIVLNSARRQHFRPLV